ncbi:MAG TPA: lipoyl(octanoyl) transferase LipB [Nevskiaceae bacterium]|nr:lipoyl(octanoyl) transferase LipB [Nevskiaceae bacterium]
MTVRALGLADYATVYAQMRTYTEARDARSEDQLWVVQHPPVFTQGQAGRPEHLLLPGSIPVVASNRGGQVTYHGPGQIVVYPLLDLHRRGYGIRSLVTRLEQAMIETLAGFGITAFARAEAPGVYVERDFGAGPEARKIGSLGLRVTRGCSYHGLSLNVDMDLEPFSRINPCGYAGLRMTQVRELGGPDLPTVEARLLARLQALL